MRRNALFCVLLAAATLGLSRFLAAWRTWRASGSVDAAAEAFVLGAALVFAMLWLGFLLYEADRAAGQVRRKVAPYEWLLARRGGPAGREGWPLTPPAGRSGR
jgi:hypothetical protein